VAGLEATLVGAGAGVGEGVEGVEGVEGADGVAVGVAGEGEGEGEGEVEGPVAGTAPGTAPGARAPMFSGIPPIKYSTALSGLL